MKKLISLVLGLIVGAVASGCAEKNTMGTTTVVTKTTPDGQTKTTVEEKLETTPHSATKTRTETIEIKP